jgi:hypothetical protein
MSDNDAPVETKFCDERHAALEKRIDELRCWITKIDQKLWGGLVLLVLQLLGVVGLLAGKVWS